MIADYLRAVVLGAIQALAEFLPISSSGHLVIAERIGGASLGSLTFDVALHLGTLSAVLAYFWRDWLRMGRASLRDLARHGYRVDRWSEPARLALWIALGTLPAVAAGLAFGDVVEEHLRSPAVVAVMLILFAIVIGVSDHWGRFDRLLSDVNAPRALVIGVAQALALVPGVSRSGATISAARALGFDRDSAARFSFLLSAPVVFGAGVLQFSRALSADEPLRWGPMIVGTVTAGVLGALVIRGFLSFVRHRTLRFFVWYRIALGLATVAALALGIL
ncbi:MAG: undecaprenyl-diphosphatase UppP [Chloroflexi bacterium]|nr:undecaprenyl-diphosphatase UppP [Chloroflexota bacterium]MDA1004227.1 undecaprenyl-diphosphatase UppP [Chloroflexota bacterium]